MATNTLALVCHELKKPPSLEAVTLPALRANEILVKIHATGICHTDLSCMNGVFPADLPHIFGHEGMF
jgi:Zn-dependent alcohol dehydrogenase